MSAVPPAAPGHSETQDYVLSWTHYVRLLPLDDPAQRDFYRDFYKEEARRSGWSVRQLDRQIDSMLYERIALSRKKGVLLQKAHQGNTPVNPEEEIRDPYILRIFGFTRSLL